LTEKKRALIETSIFLYKIERLQAKATWHSLYKLRKEWTKYLGKPEKYTIMLEYPKFKQAFTKKIYEFNDLLQVGLKGLTKKNQADLKESINVALAAIGSTVAMDLQLTE
jgi:hypothetical protein